MTYTVEKRAEIREQYEQGVKLEAIAEYFGMTAQSVCQMAARWQWERLVPTNALSGDELLRARWATRMPALKAAVRAAAGGT